ncbi:methyltransferase [Anaerovibrio lipolyticus]|uniref:Methyltransferase n=1 Tax=Anaerovibrio lipolyticus TaxID=82374 RepID=A0A0B2JY79_9FIRM|nr:class I SAM-dependent methyltransferase [Anaerovibrio lipolyticus]KHM51658.1 methyltransferase [Anaerovibrio lipolyticus]
MKTEWDYTKLADAYLKRPDYAESALRKMLSIANMGGARRSVCDVGAGAAHLTLFLARENFDVHAVEPNDAMRKNGMMRTESYKNVTWFEGVGEHTGQQKDYFDLVTFGSSFNVCNRQEALEETQRILKKDGYFACMWNHRVLNDPVQAKIEAIIKSYVPDYDYGSRREDQTEVIKESGRFTNIQHFSSQVMHEMLVDDVIEGWRSHGTLERQVGDKFPQVVDEIAVYLKSLKTSKIKVPYETNVYMAKVIK